MKRDYVKIGLILAVLIFLVLIFRPQLAEFLARLLKEILQKKG